MDEQSEAGSDSIGAGAVSQNATNDDEREPCSRQCGGFAVYRRGRWEYLRRHGSRGYLASVVM